MSNTVIFGKLEIESPYVINKLCDLEIEAAINEHVKLIYTGIIAKDKKDEYINQSNLTDKIVIKLITGDDKKIIFAGQPTNLQVSADNENYYLSVEAYSYTLEMDIIEKSRSYQDEKMTYDAMIQSVISQYNKPDFINICGKQKEIELFALQYEETDWAFLKRMASRLQAVLVAEGRQDSPKFWFGLPDAQEQELNLENFTVRKTMEPYLITNRNYKPDITELAYTLYEIQTSQYFYIGDKIKLNNISVRVMHSKLIMKNGILCFEYILIAEAGLCTNIQYNEKVKGLSLRGTVVERLENKIKMKLDIDVNNADCASRWIPFESGYSYKKNVGIYSMPELEDFVNLHIPSGDENEAFCFYTTHKDGNKNTKNTDDKIFGTQNNKEFKMSNGQLRFRAKAEQDGNVDILMTEKDGIKLTSDANISINSSKDINVTGKMIKTNAKGGIYLLCGSGSIAFDDSTHVSNSKIQLSTQIAASAPKISIGDFGNK